MNAKQLDDGIADTLVSVGRGKITREVTNGEGADLALNGVGGSIMGSLLNSLAFGGRPTQSAEILKEIARLFESGALKPPIASAKYPLSEAAQAYRCVASGKSEASST